MASHSRSPAAVVFQITWKQKAGSGHAAPVKRTFRRTLEMSWIPESGERVQLSEGGAASVLVDSLEWMLDGRPLIKLMPWESHALPWPEDCGFVEVADH